MLHSFRISSTGHLEDVAKDLKRQFEAVRQAHSQRHAQESNGAEEYDSKPLDGVESLLLALVKGFPVTDDSGISVQTSGAIATVPPGGSTISVIIATRLATRLNSPATQISEEKETE